MSGQAAPNPGPGYRDRPQHRIELYPSPKRVRVRFGGRTVADSDRTLLLLESRYHPVYYFPPDSVDRSVLSATSHDSYCPFKGQASYWTIESGGRSAENAVWAYPNPYDEVAAITDYFAFYWDRVDQWLEEDEEIFTHVRNPRVRIDVIASSRPVQVTVNGEVIGRSERALFLFETGLPARYYLPAADVRTERLKPSETRTSCPYKGKASHWHYSHNGHEVADIAWSYPEPFPEALRVRDHICFYSDRVGEILLDGRAA